MDNPPQVICLPRWLRLQRFNLLVLCLSVPSCPWIGQVGTEFSLLSDSASGLPSPGLSSFLLRASAILIFTRPRVPMCLSLPFLPCSSSPPLAPSWNMSGCHEVPHLPRETTLHNVLNLQKWPLVQHSRSHSDRIANGCGRLRTAAASSERVPTPDHPRPPKQNENPSLRTREKMNLPWTYQVARWRCTHHVLQSATHFAAVPGTARGHRGAKDHEWPGTSRHIFHEKIPTIATLVSVLKPTAFSHHFNSHQGQ